MTNPNKTPRLTTTICLGFQIVWEPLMCQPLFAAKGYYGINAQAICNSHLVFTNAVVRWPGSTHDAFVWANCELARRFEGEEFGESSLIGDSGYPLRPWLLVPYLNVADRAQD